MRLSRKLGLAFILLLSLQMFASEKVEAQPVLISITVDGIVEGTDAIQRNGNIYTFTSSFEDASIVIDASNIVLDGAGFTLQGEFYQVNGDNVEIKNLEIVSPVTAIAVYGSACKIVYCEIQAEFAGIKFWKSNNNVLSGNHIDSNAEAGIEFSYSSNNTVIENIVASDLMEGGATLTYSDYNTVSNNTISFLTLYKSSHNIIEDNSLPQGVSLSVSSNNNKITNNRIIDFNELTETNAMSDGSITLQRQCEGNIISSNTLSNSGGILLDESPNNVLKNNAISGADIGFDVSSVKSLPSLSPFINDIDESNTIDGKPIYYLVNKNGLNIDPSGYPEIGYLALINCTRITIQNIKLEIQGMLLAYTTDALINGNKVSSHGDAITLIEVANSNVTMNRIHSNSGAGILLSYSKQNLISDNILSNNQIGLSLGYWAENNTITRNEIANQAIGVDLRRSSDNLFCLNNFVNNTKHVYDASWANIEGLPAFVLPSMNIWDNGFQEGGNYWSNYISQYPNAKEVDDSGFWDTPYVVDQNNKDMYPLVAPFDTAANQDSNVSDTESPTASTENAFPTMLILAFVMPTVVTGIGLLIYFKKHKH